MDECEHNEPNVTLLDLTNDENDVDDETMSGMQVIYIYTCVRYNVVQIKNKKKRKKGIKKKREF